ncbi:multidrug ABC transporter [Candidatus Falkowbacteria bacterium HGW-Falkowbacteria-2]|uniref:Multidrug ABC transporter n=1 Tax=Candidatus Falkowbacteria bacterium HGW-Falkowbacteria-2 TaxID=2013769 RepID=A0A2N2E3Q2_9BACT|nr:MAG: multidrug ABC transporter [Candidatus Falkowbacteria bacterium HGW-Falkowbacteria-2]
MKYDLDLTEDDSKKGHYFQSAKKMWPLVSVEKKVIIIALLATIVHSTLSLAAPRLVAHTIDTYIALGNFGGVLLFAGIILVIYLLGLATQYAQIRIMGEVGQRVLFRLRSKIFNKLQELPVAFFNQNKAGDLISRINNDTEKINVFFSQALVQFVGSLFLMTGSAIFLLSINSRLGGATLTPAIFLLVITLLLSPWVKKTNLISARTLGGLSSEIQESLNNFKVIIAFNRRDFFKKRFQEVNKKNYIASIIAGVANNTFAPIYGLAANAGQLIILIYGIILIGEGMFTVGLLISFLMYANTFYGPLRQLAALWASLQAALASWDRVHDILTLESNLPVLPELKTGETNSLLTFKDVEFQYSESEKVLHKINLNFEKGKTYALVGPTGGGKTTTASLMARLYDPTSGHIYFNGRDIRSLSHEERTNKIGFILQEPILFSGTLRENILYGNSNLIEADKERLSEVIARTGIDKIISRFEQGLETPLLANGDAVSLGQKQLIAFIRAVLREPDLLILDEATANIDTVTEGLLEEVLNKLPQNTTKVIIAHRLNTIENADEIYFINAGEVTPAGSKEEAVELLLNRNSQS